MLNAARVEDVFLESGPPVARLKRPLSLDAACVEDAC